MVDKDGLVLRFLKEVAKDDSLINNNDFNQERLEEVCNELKNIYSNGYRHMYSNIFTFVTDVYSEDKSELLINNLINNLNCINDYLNKNRHALDANTKKSFKKLLDHINLDIARINYIQGLFDISSNILEEVKIDVVDKQKQLEKQTNNLDKKVDRHTYDIIGIASLIFSAFSLLSINVTLFTAITSKDSISIYKVILLMVLFNFITISSVIVIYKMVKGISND